jgi:protein arginine N-methyltransferase 6
MLVDYKRCSAYYDAIMRFKEDFAVLLITMIKTNFQGKVVLDIGCGTGILSVFCARAGAKKVYGLEASSVYLQAREFIKDNECDDVVEILHGKVEEVRKKQCTILGWFTNFFSSYYQSKRWISLCQSGWVIFW